ncbi:MAG: pyruvate kinase [Gaiellaceae bacterium]|jgi:pyruvate kinase
MAGDRRRTKIVATLGPASASLEVVRELARAGADAFRLNFSHGERAEHERLAGFVREVQAEAGRSLALIGDLQGPKIRLGEIDPARTLEPGERVVLAAEEKASGDELPLAPAVAVSALDPGHTVLIDDGSVRLQVEKVSRGRATCTVVEGGEVSSHKGVNLPGVALPIPSLTDKDLGDLELALELELDYIALSFVRAATDVGALRELIDAHRSTTGVIAKIEMPQAVAALDEIIAAADAVIVARGDLGVEVGQVAVPLLQKRIIAAALEQSRPVITATQMLESMVSSPEPTRAETSDVANAILDGSSALLLCEETAVGEYPLEAVRFMDEIARAVEPSLGFRHRLPRPGEQPSIGLAMSNAACDVAELLQATAILAPTFSGRTPSALARLRPRRPIVALSHNRHVLQKLALEWGVIPLEIPPCPNIDTLWRRSIETARAVGLVSSGDRVVITAGTAVNIAGSTNVIKVEEVL